MKKVVVLLISFVILFSSCGKKDKPNRKPHDNNKSEAVEIIENDNNKNEAVKIIEPEKTSAEAEKPSEFETEENSEEDEKPTAQDTANLPDNLGLPACIYKSVRK